MKSCLICDDHALVREALAGTVRLGWPGAKTTDVGDFPSGWAAAAAGHDLILADLMMPGADPIAGIDGLLQAAPGTPVLVITGTEDDTLLLALLDHGVAGFAPKSASGAIIEAAMRLILAGGRYLPPRVADIASARLSGGGVMPAPATENLPDRLTDRQLEVLRLMAQGRTNKDIARLLAIAPSTIKSHISQILVTLGTTNRTEAAMKARLLKLVSAP